MPVDADDELEALRVTLNLPFYLYDGPDFDDGSWFAPCARGLRGETYVEDQYSGEYYFLQQLRGHRWRVRDPATALLFVVPLYVNAALQPSMAASSCNGTHFQHLFDRTASAVAGTAQYERHLGADHVLVCNSWKLAQKPPHQAPWTKLGHVSNDYFRHVFRNAIVGHMETRHGGDGGFWRCSVVSPYVANYDDGARAHLVQPSARERDVSFYFQGGANNRGTYGYAFRQAALAQLEALPRAHISASSLPGKPVDCRGDARRGGIATNCLSRRSNPAFRTLMRRSRFNLVLRGDSPSSRRLYDGIAVGTLNVLVSDQLWSVGLPFGCLVPWRRMVFTVREAPFNSSEGAMRELEAIDALTPQVLARMQRVSNKHRRDVIWNVNGSRVAENLLITAALRCLPSHVVRSHRGAAVAGAASAAKGDAPRAPAVSRAIRSLRQMCPQFDGSIACRLPDEANCAGCETGELAGATPIEHCCGDSCPACNRTASRCVPPSVFYGDPLTHDPRRRAELEGYLGQRDKTLPAELRRWRSQVGRPQLAKQLAAEKKVRSARVQAKPAAGRGAEKAMHAAHRPGGASAAGAAPTGGNARAGVRKAFGLLGGRPHKNVSGVLHPRAERLKPGPSHAAA